MAFDNLLNPVPSFPQASQTPSANFGASIQNQYPNSMSAPAFGGANGAASFGGQFSNSAEQQALFAGAPTFSSGFNPNQFHPVSSGGSLQPSAQANAQANITTVYSDKENTDTSTTGSKRPRRDSDNGREWTPLPLSFVQRLAEVHELTPANHKRVLQRYRWQMDARSTVIEAQLDLSSYALSLETLQATKAVLNYQATLKDDVALVIENIKTNFTPSKQTIAYANKTSRDLIVKPDRTNFVEALKEETMTDLITNHEAAGIPPLATRPGTAMEKTRKVAQTVSNNARSALMKDAVHSVNQETTLKDFAFDTAKDYVREGAAMPLDPHFVGSLAVLRAFVQERAAAVKLSTSAATAQLSTSTAAAELSTPMSSSGSSDRAQHPSQSRAQTTAKKSAEDAAVGTFWSAYERWLSGKHEDKRTKTAWQTFVDEIVVEDNKKFDPSSVPTTYSASQGSPAFEADDDMYA